MNELYLPDQNAYPQFQESVDSNAPKQEGSLSPSDFHHHPAVHHRPPGAAARYSLQHAAPGHRLVSVGLELRSEIFRKKVWI